MAIKLVPGGHLSHALAEATGKYRTLVPKVPLRDRQVEETGFPFDELGLCSCGFPAHLLGKCLELKGFRADKAPVVL
jgi:hypothetical protein